MPVFQLSEEILFPPPHLAEPDGLIAVGGDLSWQRLLAAYRHGIFPWFGEGDPVLWWTPSPRLVLFPSEFHLSKRLTRTIRQGVFSATADTAFNEVIEKCATNRSKNRKETWITRDMIQAYCRLHEMGYAHSIECWNGKTLVGGLYGVALDRVFFGESMYAEMSNASKVALHNLVRFSLRQGIGLIDCQMKTQHLVSLGAREISRDEFQSALGKYISNLRAQKKWRLQDTDKEGIGLTDACQEERRNINE